MTMELVELRPSLDCENIAKGLRNIADDIEAGAIRFTPTMAVVVLATETQMRERESTAIFHDWQTHGLGKDASVFVQRGILASALQAFDGPNDA